MQPISDFIILDFCEWLKSQSGDKNIQEIESRDVINREIIVNYAVRYLEERTAREKTCISRDVLVSFLKSIEYNETIERCSKLHEGCEECYYRARYDLKRYLSCINNEAMQDAFKDFYLKNRYLFNESTQIREKAEYIADSLSYYSKKQESYKMGFMINLPNEKGIDIDFLEWLQEKSIDKGSLIKMPDKVLSDFISEYVRDRKKSKTEEAILLRSFNKNGIVKLMKSIKKAVRPGPVWKSKTSDYIVDRVVNNRAEYNCFILLRDADESRHFFKSLNTSKWIALNELSKNYLDIYYSENDIKRSGAEIADRIHNLPEDIRFKAPCLVIWSTDIRSAKCVELKYPSMEEFYSVIRTITEAIANKESLESIVEEVNKMQDKDQKASVQNYYSGENVTVLNQDGHHNKASITVEQKDSNKEITISQFDKALKAIAESDELTNEQKEALSKIMEEAKAGVKENSQEKKERAKASFGFVKAFLNGAPKLLAVLGDLAAIASVIGPLL